MKLFLLLPSAFLLCSCDILEGIRQTSRDYIPREERARIKQALKEYRASQAEFAERYAKEIKDFNDNQRP